MIRRKYKPPRRPTKKAVAGAIAAQWPTVQAPDPVDPETEANRLAEREAAAADLQRDIAALKQDPDHVPF